MDSSPFSKIPNHELEKFYQLIPEIRDQVSCKQIYDALALKGPMQLMQLCVVVTGPNLTRLHCKRLLNALAKCGLVGKKPGKKIYKALWN